MEVLRVAVTGSRRSPVVDRELLHTIRQSAGLLDPRDRRRLLILMVVQSLTAFLDLAAIALIGLTATLASGAASRAYPTWLDGLLTRVSGTQTDPYRVVLWLGAIAAVLLLTKTLASFWVTRRTFRFLANRQAMISGGLAQRLLTRPLLDVRAMSSQDISYALTNGVNALTMGVLGQTVMLVSEISLLAALGVGLLFVDATVTIFTVLFFGVVAVLTQRALGRKASRLGSRFTETQVASFESLQELLAAYREITVSGRRESYVSSFRRLRWDFAEVQGEINLMSQLTKYIFEVALVVGGVLLVGSQLLTKETATAVGVIAVFLVATSRIIPSLLRLQMAALTMRSNGGMAHTVLQLADDLQIAEADPSRGAAVAPVTLASLAEGLATSFPEFSGSVACQSVTFGYPGSSVGAINDVSVSVPAGASLALVGQTGAGKSTLVDLLLGVLEPDVGRIEVSGLTPRAAISRWPGALAYVPQDSVVVQGSIRRNVCLGLPDELIDDDRVWEALDRARLADVMSSLREGLETEVGESGFRLSGGQRQRLGIARALYTRPRLLVLDEATSALDAETENEIAQTISNLAGQVTLIIVAHRLATVRDCDQVAYLDGGRLEALGTFDEVRTASPRFNSQAVLLGL